MDIIFPQWTSESNLKMLAVPGQRFKWYVNISGIASFAGMSPDVDADDDTMFDFQAKIITAPRWYEPIAWTEKSNIDSTLWDITKSVWISSSSTGPNNYASHRLTDVHWKLIDQGNQGLQIELTVFITVVGGVYTNIFDLGYFVSACGNLAPIDDTATKI